MIDSHEVCSVWVDTHSKARKRHLCDCCWRVIEAGTVYLTNFNVFQGNASNGKMCNACEEILERFSESHDGMRFSPHDMGHVLSECIDESFEESEWRQDLDFIRLGIWLAKKNKFNRTVSGRGNAHSYIRAG